MIEHQRLVAVAKLCAIAIALATIGVMAPAWQRLIAPKPGQARDFFQDYASARNLLTGRPIYTHQADTLREYLGLSVAGDVNIAYNAHPPTSVLLALPLAGLDYITAGWWWNVFSLLLLAGSLGVIAWQLRWRPALWSLLVGLAVLMTWVPLWLHVLQGQLGLVLLALFTLAWSLGRHHRGTWAGAAIGVAATIKLFPALLLGCFLPCRDWRALVTGALAGLVVTVGTVAALGVEAFTTYVSVVLPSLDRWRPDWINASLAGFFARLFAPDSATRALIESPALAIGLTLLSIAGVCLVVAIVVVRVGPDFDAFFGLVLTATLLISALTWSHYFVVLLLPLAIWIGRLRHCGRRTVWRWSALALVWALMSVPQLDLALAAIPDGVATPLLAISVLSLNFYGLLGFLIAQAWWLWSDAAHARRLGPPSETATNPRLVSR